MPTYSIVVPVYNVEKYLESCIESVLTQITDASYELILVDDGSIDRSPEICDRYAERFSNVKVIHQVNQGVSAARNAGIAASKGSYILFLDSDDLWEKTLLETVSAALTEMPDMVIFGYREFGERGIVDEALPDPFEENGTGLRYFEHYEACRVMPIVNCWAAAFRREFLIENQISFPTHIGFGEDFLFHMCSLKAAQKVTAIAQALYWYRVNETSITHTLSLKKIREHLIACSDAYRLIPCALLANYYSMQILLLADLKRDEAVQLKNILRKNRDIQRAISGRKQRFVCLMYDILGWYGTARAVRLCLNIRNQRK